MSNVLIVASDNVTLNEIPQVSVTIGDFIRVVDSLGSEIVFSCEIDYDKKDCYLVFHKGSVVYTRFMKVDTWDEFKSMHIKMQEGGFTEYSKLQDAQEYGISSNGEYEDFIRSDAYYDQREFYSKKEKKKELYNLYLNVKKSGFENFSQYKSAYILGIADPIEYDLFTSSEWGKRDYYIDNYSDYDKNSYIEFCDARKKGFTSKDAYQKAVKMGFEDAKVYRMFVESGLNDKKDFDYVIYEFPSTFDNEMNIAEQSKKEADVAFKNSRYQESVSKNFIQVEKLLNAAYVLSHKRKPERKIDYVGLLEELNSKHNLGIAGLKKFRHCRQIRNKVAHENYKVTEEEALSVKNCLEELVSVLLPFIKSMFQQDFKDL